MVPLEVHHEAGAMLRRPADKKWFRNFGAARIVREVLEAVDPRPPRVDLDPRNVEFR